jgi:hypothetical protein
VARAHRAGRARRRPHADRSVARAHRHYSRRDPGVELVVLKRGSEHHPPAPRE